MRKNETDRRLFLSTLPSFFFFKFSCVVLLVHLICNLLAGHCALVEIIFEPITKSLNIQFDLIASWSCFRLKDSVNDSSTCCHRYVTGDGSGTKLHTHRDICQHFYHLIFSAAMIFTKIVLCVEPPPVFSDFLPVCNHRASCASLLFNN